MGPWPSHRKNREDMVGACGASDRGIEALRARYLKTYEIGDN